MQTFLLEPAGRDFAEMAGMATQSNMITPHVRESRTFP